MLDRRVRNFSWNQRICEKLIRIKITIMKLQQKKPSMEFMLLYSNRLQDKTFILHSDNHELFKGIGNQKCFHLTAGLYFGKINYNLTENTLGLYIMKMSFLLWHKRMHWDCVMAHANPLTVMADIINFPGKRLNVHWLW